MRGLFIWEDDKGLNLDKVDYMSIPLPLELSHLTAAAGPKTALGARRIAPLSIRHYSER